MKVENVTSIVTIKPRSEIADEKLWQGDFIERVNSNGNRWKRCRKLQNINYVTVVNAEKGQEIILSFITRQDYMGLLDI